VRDLGKKFLEEGSAMLIPRQTTPDVVVETLKDARFDLVAGSTCMTLVCFYRGLHRPVCSNYLKVLDHLTSTFADRGVTTISISSDTKERAHQMSEKMNFVHLGIGFGLKLADARKWEFVYLCLTRRKLDQYRRFPLVFRTRYVFGEAGSSIYLTVLSMPFARPNFLEIVEALDFVINNDYPTRGKYAGAL
jgi:AhpC/TSA family protein